MNASKPFIKDVVKWARLVAPLALALLLIGGLSVTFAARAAQPGAPFAAGSPVVGLELVADGFAHPLALATPGDGTGRLFIADQTGQIAIVAADGSRLSQPFLDISDRMVSLNPTGDERGLLGLAFHPDYVHNGRFYVYYSAPLAASAPPDWNHTSHISEFTVSAGDPNQADPNSERVLLAVDEPQANHNAGQITFGPDGYLYIPLGDGGGGGDTGTGHVPDWYEVNDGGNGQDLNANLLGSILRIDVDGGDPYGIPSDNPFAGVEQGDQILDEIWAYGFRNPWRISFDSATGDLFASDAGQNLWEEVSLVSSGGNYGWNVKEGTHCFSTANFNQSLSDCPSSDPTTGIALTDPVIEYANNRNPNGEGLGSVVVGGFMYRGSALNGFQGRYIFGDFSGDSGSGKLLLASPPPVSGQLWPIEEISVNVPGGKLNEFLLSFGQDENDELYILTSSSGGPSGDSGRVYRLTSLQSAFLPLVIK